MSALERLARALAAVRCGHPLRAGICGIDAAGKSTLADALGSRLGALGRPIVRASIDGFHHPRSHRYRRGAESPEGYFADSFALEALRARLLAPLGPGGDRRHVTAVFDWRRDAAVEQPDQLAAEDSILLLDGVFLFRPELLPQLDLRIWVEVSPATAARRLASRAVADGDDPEPLRERFARRYLPGQELFLAACRPREQADWIVENDDLEAPVLVEPSLPPRCRGCPVE